ncbi:MAG: signal peptidase II [bacterium]
MILFLVAFLIFLTDWISKLWVRQNFSPGMSIPLIEDFFYLTRVENSGFFFGLVSLKESLSIPANVLAILCLIILGRRISRKRSWGRIGLGLMVGGAGANFWDRLGDGQVTDFLDFRLWPVFNLADVAVCAGVAIFIWVFLVPICRDVSDSF